MSACPTCGKPVDSIRSRFVKVRDGKVVAFCSAEHMQEAETKPTAMPAASTRARTPVSGIPAGTGVAIDSGPVIEIIRDPASAPVGKSKSKKADGSSPGTRAPTAPPPVADGSLDSWAAADEEDDGRASRTSLPRAPTSGRAWIVVALIAAIGAAGAYLAYRYLLMDKAAPAEAPPPEKPAHAPEPPPPPPAKQITPGDAVKQAHDVLVKNLGSESPRVQRVAAAALARTGDTQAIKYLTTALGKETSDVSKLDLAYALARAGDKKGIDALVTGLSGPRDARLQAGRLLALVGDKRAVPVLSSYLEVSQLRLGAAEQLAFLADPAAIKALDAVRADPKSTPDEKARAIIALANAGRTDVTPDLQAMLKDARNNAFAASALARLRDPSAKPVLVEQLAVPSLRVEAARALRRLDPGLDATPYLPGLISALASHKDTEQVQVAEAILLLAGDAGWSERP